MRGTALHGDDMERTFPPVEIETTTSSHLTTLPDSLLALTLQQPWASAVRDLGKRTENRSWSPPQRVLGQFIAIHAGMTFREDAADWLAARTGRMLTRGNVPLGAVVALARVVKVVQEHPDDPWFLGPYGWVLDDVVTLSPVPCRGRQQLWRISDEVYADIETQWSNQMSDNSR